MVLYYHFPEIRDFALVITESTVPRTLPSTQEVLNKSLVK